MRCCKRPWYPPFAKCAKDGAPSVFLIPAKSKAWATRPGFTQFPVDPTLSYVNTEYLAFEYQTVTLGPGTSLLQGITRIAEHELTLNLSDGLVDDSGPDITADFSDSTYHAPSPDLNTDEIATIQDVNGCPMEGDVGGNQGPLDPGSPVVSAVKRRKGHIF